MIEGLQNYDFNIEARTKIMQENALALFPRFKEIMF